MTNDNNQHPGLDDGGAGIVEQAKPLRWGCVLHQCKDGWWLVRNASGTHWWTIASKEWLPETDGFWRGAYLNPTRVLDEFAKCQTPPPDWTEPEQPERFDEFTGAPTTDPANQYIVNIPLDEDHKAALLKQTNVSVSRIEVAPGWKCAPPPTTDPASRAIAAHTTPGKRHATDPTAEELDTIAEAALRGRDHLEIAVKQYGLRTYGAGMDFTLGLMGKASR